MEDLELWYSIAENLSSNKEELRSELERAEKLLKEIKRSINHSRERLLQMLSEEHVEIEEINLQEQHLALITRLFIRKRNSLINTTAKHCLQFFHKLNSNPDTSEVFIKPTNTTAQLLKLISQGSPSQIKQDLQESIHTYINKNKEDSCKDSSKEDSAAGLKRLREQRSF